MAMTLSIPPFFISMCRSLLLPRYLLPGNRALASAFAISLQIHMSYHIHIGSSSCSSIKGPGEYEARCVNQPTSHPLRIIFLGNMDHGCGSERACSKIEEEGLFGDSWLIIPGLEMSFYPGLDETLYVLKRERECLQHETR